MACRWAFSIWGLIFGLEGIGTIYQALPYGYNSEGTKQRIVNAIGGLHAVRSASSTKSTSKALFEVLQRAPKYFKTSELCMPLALTFPNRACSTLVCTLLMLSRFSSIS